MSLGRIVGAGIGFLLGGPTGARIGWTLGAFLDAPKDGEDTYGPRLDSLTVETLDYGSPIPIVYGRARIAGFRMWQRPIREVTHEETSEGGKGGGGSESTHTTYSYYGTFAIGLCEGEIVGVRKIWADSILIYNAGTNASIESIQASNKTQSSFTLYTGSSTQLADSTIQATQGAANTPAYRNLAYIVFDDLPLEKYSNRIPNITCEVVGTGSDALVIDVLDTYDLNCDTGYASSPTLITTLYADNSGVATIFSRKNGGSGVDIRKISAHGQQSFVGSYPITVAYPSLWDGWSDKPCCVYGDAGYIYRIDDEGDEKQISYISGILSGYKTTQYYERNDNKWAFWRKITGETTVYDISHGGIGAELYSSTAADRLNAMFPTNDYIYGFTRTSIFVCYDYSFNLVWSVDMSATGIAYSSDVIIREYSDDQMLVYWFTKYWAVSSAGYEYLGTHSTPTYANEYGGHHYINGLFLYCGAEQKKYTVIKVAPEITPGTVTLSSIVTDITTRAGLTVSDIDVSELTDDVKGYIISSNMSARAAIDPLQKAFFFDGAEFDNIVNFVKRGGSSISTIPEVDLGAVEYGGNSHALKQSRRQDSELPSDVSIGYISAVRDFEVATQRAQRINYSIPNTVGQDLAIVLSDDKALQIADVTLYNAYTEREKLWFSLTNEYIDLNPTDVVTVVYDGDARVARLVNLSYGDVIECEAVSDDPQVYVSTAVAADDSWEDQEIGFTGPTRIEYLDIPILRNLDNNSGIYFAVSGYYSAWIGTQIFKSLDSGATYTSIDAAFTAGTIGNATDVLADAVSTLWDRDNTVTIDLFNGTFSSSTESSVIQGSNYLLLGSEIIQFVNATMNVDGTYTLDTLLRGRRGTEWATDSHAVGDLAVLLTEATLGRFEAVINTERYYKAVTIGEYLQDTDSKAVTNTGVSLKPFSPAYIAGTRDGSNNLTITWTRRSRYIGSPLWTPPLFEESESYEVDVMSGATVLRTITATSETASYTAAQQTTDGLTPGDPVTVNVYQLSATVGRGYPTEATI